MPNMTTLCLSFREVSKAIGSQPNPLYETDMMQVCVVIEPKRKIDGVNCVQCEVNMESM